MLAIEQRLRALHFLLSKPLCSTRPNCHAFISHPVQLIIIIIKDSIVFQFLSSGRDISQSFHLPFHALCDPRVNLYPLWLPCYFPSQQLQCQVFWPIIIIIIIIIVIIIIIKLRKLRFGSPFQQFPNLVWRVRKDLCRVRWLWYFLLNEVMLSVSR